MNTFKSTESWTNSLNVDEVEHWEMRSLCNLTNAIFSEAVDWQVQKFRKERCCGRKVNHLSQRRHYCVMMTKKKDGKCTV